MDAESLPYARVCPRLDQKAVKSALRGLIIWPLPRTCQEHSYWSIGGQIEAQAAEGWYSIQQGDAKTSDRQQQAMAIGEQPDQAIGGEIW